MPNDVWSWTSCNVIINILFKASIFFPVIGKKNNQSSVTDADKEISTPGSTDKAGNVSGIIRFTLGLDRRPMLVFMFVIKTLVTSVIDTRICNFQESYHYES